MPSKGIGVSLKDKLVQDGVRGRRTIGSIARTSLVITLAEIACIIMRKIYATMGESIYPSSSSLSRDFPEASGRLLRIE